MAHSKGFYEKDDFVPFLIEGSNWTWFKKILALFIFLTAIVFINSQNPKL